MNQPAPQLRRADLVIVDDFMPTDSSPFRWVEYSHYFNRYDTAILSTEGWGRFREPLSWQEAMARSPLPEAAKWRVQRLSETTLEHARLGYVTFNTNARSALPYFRAKGIPFVLQLYPGGGFRLNDPDSDASLRAVLDLGLCRRVIATQTITRDYLIDTFDWPPDQITFIWGGVFKPAKPFEFHRDKTFYPRDKDTLDICFVANKYGTNLSAKGFDAFVGVAEQLTSEESSTSASMSLAASAPAICRCLGSWRVASGFTAGSTSPSSLTSFATWMSSCP